MLQLDTDSNNVLVLALRGYTTAVRRDAFALGILQAIENIQIDPHKKNLKLN